MVGISEAAVRWTDIFIGFGFQHVVPEFTVRLTLAKYPCALSAGL